MNRAIMQDIALELAADTGRVMLAVRDAQLSGCTDDATDAIRAALPSLRLSVDALAAAVGIEPVLADMGRQGRDGPTLGGGRIMIDDYRSFPPLPWWTAWPPIPCPYCPARMKNPGPVGAGSGAGAGMAMGTAGGDDTTRPGVQS